MKLKFKNQEFQTIAADAVADLFAGQENKRSTFEISSGAQLTMQNEFGIGNAQLISPVMLQHNMNEIQQRNKLPMTDDLQGNQFCIEMETGTGKTYVYTKTIFELNKRYGFTKFVIVVPSVAIREGVNSSLNLTSEHFGTLYDNTPYYNVPIKLDRRLRKDNVPNIVNAKRKAGTGNGETEIHS